MKTFFRQVLLCGLMTALMPVSYAQTVIKLAHDQPERSTHHQAALKWKELIESRTGGKYQVRLYPSMLLGSGTQMVEQIQAGALEVAVLPTGWIAPLAPSVQVLDLPFLFPNRDVAYRVVDGPAGREILAPLAKVNITGVAFWESGFKQFTGNFPIREPKDFGGKKIRTMPAPVIQEQFRAFGSTPVAIDFKELYSALQQRVVDGQENPVATISVMKFNEVQKHITLSDHGFLAYVFMINKPWLDAQPADVQKIFTDAAREAGRFQREIIAKAEAEQLDQFRKSGNDIMKLSDDQRKAFELASKPVYDWYVGRQGATLLNMVRGEVAKAAKR